MLLFSYLTLNDVIEVSAVWKIFCYVSRKDCTEMINVKEKNLLQAKEVLMKKWYYSIRPFCVWNMCKYCSKLYKKDKKKQITSTRNCLSKFCKKKNFKQRIYLYPHTMIQVEKKMLFDERLSALYHERLISHFLVWKVYLEILCRIVFNISNRFFFLCLHLVLIVQIWKQIELQQYITMS